MSSKEKKVFKYRNRLESRLNKIEKLYIESSDPFMQAIYSKNYIMELSGYIETSIKSYMFELMSRKKIVNKECHTSLKRLFGFNYSNDLRKNIVNMFGNYSLELVESEFNKSADLDILKSSLGTISQIRNENAHTYIQGATVKIRPPQNLKKDKDNILEKFEKLSILLGKE
jgi:hypothetical protein